jgi:aspartyl-tRNA synthetase
MDTAEGLIKHLVKGVQKECGAQLEHWKTEFWVPKQFPRVLMKEAKTWLAEKGKKLSPEEDLDAEAEKLLGEIARKKFDSDFIFVCRYPWTKRPFYHMKPDADPTVSKSFALLCNGLEVGTGAQREHRYEILKKQAQEKGVDLDEMQDYALLFQYGCPPHGGCGLGLDRFMEAMLRLPNIREGILLPRDPVRLRP